MYTTCPKCSYERGKTDTVDEGTCPACGIIFSKWMKHQFISPDAVVDHSSENVSKKRTKIFNLIIDRILFIEPSINPFYFYGRVIGLLFMTYSG